METYRRMWRAVCGVLVGAGVVIAFVVLPGMVWILAGLLAVVIALTAAVGADDETGGRLPIGRAIVVGGVASAVLVALLAFGVFLDVGVFIPVLVLLALAPRAVSQYAKWLGASGTTRTAVSAVGKTDTTELCRKWLDSYDALRRAESCREQLRIVMARQRYLDELEQRDPDGFQAWLAAAAGPATDPRRYLTDHDT